MSLEVGIDAVCAILSLEGAAGIDTETTIARSYDREICTIQITHQGGRRGFAQVYRKPEDIRRLAQALNETRLTLAAHNAAFEQEVFAKIGAHPKLKCTMIAARVLRGVLDGGPGDDDE